MIIKEGSKWSSVDGKTFLVLAVIEKEGHVWIHYRDEGKSNNKEYSCYVESFRSRFTPLP